MPDDGPSTDNLNGGWIRAYRSLVDPRRDPFWEHGMRTGDFRQWAAWIYCLTLVNYQPEPSKLFVRGRLILVRQGEFFVTQENLARQMGWESRKPVRNFFASLKQLGRIGPQEGPFQVVNWQDYNTTEGQRTGHKRATTGPQGGHLQEDKHEALRTKTQEPASPAAPLVPTADERRKTEADKIVALYKSTVKSAGDTSRRQAAKTIAKLLGGGIAAETLTRCVERYAQEMAMLDRDNEHRKNAGNFFGREEVYVEYLLDGWVLPAAHKSKDNFHHTPAPV